MPEQLIIGVDGGGTKTIASLARLATTGGESMVLGNGQSGPGNPRAVGFDTAQANIAAAIAAAYAAARLPQTPARGACFGLAGAGRASERERLAAWATQANIARLVLVTDDAEPILAAASPDNIGIALICGTGSLASGRNAAGQISRCGGWGYLLGDEGSAYQIARAGLQAAMRASDGRGPPTSLLAALQNALTADSIDQIVERIYAPETTRERLAHLATVVFAAASDGVAAVILEQAAAELAELVCALARRLDLAREPFPLALAGSVLIQQTAFREQMLDRLRAAGLCPRPVSLIAEPVRGAVALARRLATT